VVTFRFFRNLLDRIWGPVEAVTDSRSFDYSKDLPRAVSEGACEWLERHGREGPFCLFLHYDGPHFPYRLPDPYTGLFATVPAGAADPAIVDCFYPQQRERLGPYPEDDPCLRRIHEHIKAINYRKRCPDPQTLQFLLDKYDASTKYNDDMLALVHDALQSLGLGKQTILAVFSDHGEEFLDHGHLGHGGVHLYEEVIRTVGIIHDPAQQRSQRIELPVSHVQILPTLLKLAGHASLPPDLDRLDIGLALARHRQGETPEPVFCVGEFKTAVRLDNLKWICAQPSGRHSLLKRLRLRLRMLQIGEWRNELFDLAADPSETVNLAGRVRQSRPLAAALRRHLQSTASRLPLAGSARDLSDAERQRIEQELKDLGYL
jgi:arylsulfatase A-like enzyme